MRKYKAAVAQMRSGMDLDANLADAEALIRQAAEERCQLVALPENFFLMSPREQDKLELREEEGGRIQDFLSRCAQAYQVWLIGGTVPLAANDGTQRLLSTCPLYDPEGRCVGKYHKIHLFDALVDADSGERYQESSAFAAGERVCVLPTALGRIGLAICYDLRFPELFRRMLADDVELIAIPSAFTAKTGQAHWESLLRARAIENQCHVLAANQCGEHDNGRSTWGHSAIIDPWGRTLARLEEGVGIAAAEIDLSMQTDLRTRMPCLSHRTLALEAPPHE